MHLFLLALLAQAAPATPVGASEQQTSPTQPAATLTSTDFTIPPYAETVIVTASRIEETLLNAPAAMTVIGREQIETSAATNVAELLQGAAGLNVARFSTREFAVASRQPAAALGQGQLVLLDGRVVNTATAACIGISCRSISMSSSKWKFSTGRRR